MVAVDSKCCGWAVYVYVAVMVLVLPIWSARACICGRSAIAVETEHLSSEQRAVCVQQAIPRSAATEALPTTVYGESSVELQLWSSWTRRDGSRRCHHRRRMSDVISV